MTDLSERAEKKGILRTLLVSVLDIGELVVDGEVHRQMQIYFKGLNNMKIFPNYYICLAILRFKKLFHRYKDIMFH